MTLARLRGFPAIFLLNGWRTIVRFNNYQRPSCAQIPCRNAHITRITCRILIYPHDCACDLHCRTARV